MNRNASSAFAVALLLAAGPVSAGFEQELDKINRALDAFVGEPPAEVVAQSDYASEPPPLVWSGPPRMAVVPSGDAYIYMVPQVYGVYFFRGMWYRVYDGAWWRADAYRGPWYYVDVGLVPPFVTGVPPEYAFHLPRGYHQIPFNDMHRHWRDWDKRRYWHGHEWYRHEMRHDVIRERHSFIERDRAQHRFDPPRRHDPPPHRGPDRYDPPHRGPDTHAPQHVVPPHRGPDRYDPPHRGPDTHAPQHVVPPRGPDYHPQQGPRPNHPQGAPVRPQSQPQSQPVMPQGQRPPSGPQPQGQPQGQGQRPPSGQQPQGQGQRPPSGQAPQNTGGQRPQSGQPPQGQGQRPPSGQQPQGQPQGQGQRPPSGQQPQGQGQRPSGQQGQQGGQQGQRGDRSRDEQKDRR